MSGIGDFFMQNKKMNCKKKNYPGNPKKKWQQALLLPLS